MFKKTVLTAFALAASVAAAQAGPNLVNNGNFAAGNTGFQSGYGYVAPAPNALWPEGLYTIGTNPFDVHSYWVDAPANPTIMLVNGYAGSGPQPAIWQENGIGGTGTYLFSATVQNLCCNATFGNNTNAPSSLAFQFSNDGTNWTDITTYTTSPGYPAPGGDDGVLENISAQFSDVGTFDVRAMDGSSAAGGNDFGITNLSVVAASTPVPEPITLSLFGAGLAGAAVMRRRRKKAA